MLLYYSSIVVDNDYSLQRLINAERKVYYHCELKAITSYFYAQVRIESSMGRFHRNGSTIVICDPF
jgi:hypothetical protein